ncbi:uncharacterized protein [Dermacentor albipictus]|uniref:uncharacterized protein isoform X9 n=1 Tax=Dermacentor albipictus TaxID=60249 RepID=UPI0038FD2632
MLPVRPFKGNHAVEECHERGTPLQTTKGHVIHPALMLIRTWTQGCRCKNDTTVIAKDQKNSPISFSHRGGGGYARVSRSVQLVDLVVRKHELVTFRCGIYGSPPPKIAWFHDGGPIRNSATRMFLPIGQLFLLQVQHKAARNRTVDSAGARPLTCWASETIVSGLPVKHGTSKQVQRMRFMCRIRLLPALSCTQCFAASALRPNSLHVASASSAAGHGARPPPVPERASDHRRVPH